MRGGVFTVGGSPDAAGTEGRGQRARGWRVRPSVGGVRGGAGMGEEGLPKELLAGVGGGRLPRVREGF